MPKTAGAEDSLVDDILANDGGGDSGGAEDAALDEGGEAQQQPARQNQQQQQPNAGGRSDARPAGAKPPAGQQQQQQQQTPPQDNGAARAGDLVDNQGRVVARAGAERRMYERAFQSVRTQYDREMSALQGQVEAFQTAHASVAQLGIQPAELQTAYNLFAAYKKNPVETVKYLLTQLRASGQNIEGIGNGVDTAAIAEMVRAELQPFRADREAQEQHQQFIDGIEAEYSDFVGRYPDATTHEADIAALLDADARLSPEAAYLKLQNFALYNRLDWTKPLGPQIDARAQGGGQQQQQQRQGLPTGRATPNGKSVNSQFAADENTPTRDIVKQAMRDAGYKIE